MATVVYTKSNKNFIRAYRLLIDIGTPVLRSYLETLITIQGFNTMDNFLKCHFKRFSKSLQRYQHACLYPSSGGPVKTETWDLSLLCWLLRECFNPSPVERQAVDTLRRVRNTMFSHRANTSLDDVKFEDVWKDLKTAIVKILNHVGDKRSTNETLQNIQAIRDRRVDADEGVLDRIQHQLERLISLTENNTQEMNMENDKVKLQRFLVKTYLEYSNMACVPVCPLKTQGRIHVDKIYVEEKFEDITPLVTESTYGHDSCRNIKENQTTLRSSFKSLFQPRDTNNPPRHIVLVGEAGRGKTTVCLKLVSLWSSAIQKTLNDETDLTEMEEDLIKYELLYFISLRDAVEEDSVIDMIESQILAENEELIANVKNCFKCMPDKCLVIADGLDELTRCSSQKLPKRTGLNYCTILWTTRHSKLCLLSDLQNVRVLEIAPLNDESIRSLVRNVLIELYLVPDSSVDKRVENFMTDLSKHGMQLVAEIPLVLTYLVCQWQEERGLEDSRSVNFSGLLNLLLRKAELPAAEENHQKQTSTQNLPLPGALDFYEDVRKQALFLRKLCPFAYDCCLQALTVFEAGQVEAIIGEKNMRKCLLSGLLSLTSIPRHAPKQHVWIQFFHKTLQELLAAIWISSTESKGRALDKMLSACNTTEKIIEMSTILVFACGLNPKQAETISQHIANTALSEKVFIRYRQTLQSRYSFRRPRDACAPYRRVRRIQQILIECKREVVLNFRYCGGIHNRISTQFGSVFAERVTDTGFRLYDIIIADNVDTPTLQILTDNTNHLRSIYIDLPLAERNEYIEEVICKSSQLQRIHLDHTSSSVVCRLSNSQMERIYSMCLCLDNISTLPASMAHLKNITALCLSVSGSHRMVINLEEFLRSSTTLKELELEQIICSDHKRERERCRYLVDISAAKDLKSLRLEDVSPECIFLSASVQLEDVWISGAASNPSSCLCRLPESGTLSTVILGHLKPFRSWSMADYETIVHVLPELKHLEYLYLIGINFEQYGATPRIFSQRKLKRISLESIQLSKQGWVELLLSLVVNEERERNCEAELYLISTNVQKYQDVLPSVLSAHVPNSATDIIVDLKQTKSRERLLCLRR